jgi:hypothetical protein
MKNKHTDPKLPLEGAEMQASQSAATCVIQGNKHWQQLPADQWLRVDHRQLTSSIHKLISDEQLLEYFNYRT